MEIKKNKRESEVSGFLKNVKSSRDWQPEIQSFSDKSEFAIFLAASIFSGFIGFIPKTRNPDRCLLREHAIPNDHKDDMWFAQQKVLRFNSGKNKYNQILRKQNKERRWGVETVGLLSKEWRRQ